MENKLFKAKLTARSPIMMHNGQLANPLSPAAKALAAVSKGKAKDLSKTARAEFMGSLYLDEKGEPCIPVDNVMAAVIAGAKAYKLGKQAAAGVYDLPEHQTFPLLYKGPRDPIALYESPEHVDARSVRVQMSRIIRTRPIFRNWHVNITLEYDPTLISSDDMQLAIERAGKAIGIGDYRPRYGRFTVEVL